MDINCTYPVNGESLTVDGLATFLTSELLQITTDDIIIEVKDQPGIAGIKCYTVFVILCHAFYEMLSTGTVFVLLCYVFYEMLSTGTVFVLLCYVMLCLDITNCAFALYVTDLKLLLNPLTLLEDGQDALKIELTSNIAIEVPSTTLNRS